MDGKEWREKHRILQWEWEHDSSVFIYSQKELDEVPDDFKGFIHISFGTEKERAVLDRELSAQVWVCGGSVMEIRKPNEVIADSGSIVYAWSKYGVKKIHDAKVYDLEEVINMNKIEQTLNSIEVAEMVGKDHKALLKDIRRYVAQINEVNIPLVETSQKAADEEHFNGGNISLVEFFQESTYSDRKGEVRPCYNVTKKGCEFIAHKLTGAKGTEFTAQYINKFHDMEEQLQNPLEGLSIELQSVIVVDKRVTKVEGRINKLENNMTINHEQIQTIKNRVNQKITELLGGRESNAYNDKALRARAYSSFGKSYCDYFKINARANTLISKFVDALEYVDMWQPETNLTLQIVACNAQEKIGVEE